MKVSLLIIDPQNDFCSSQGALYVPGADKDCEKLSEMIIKLESHIQSIHITMDTHHLFHIAQPVFWVDQNGQHPKPFTLISVNSINTGEFKASVSQYQKYALEYVSILEKTGKYTLCIWPPHCLIGSWGHGIYEPLWRTLTQWENTLPGRFIDYTYKGSNIKTEHYSAVRAEVADAADPDTRTNFTLIERLKQSDTIVISGEALSHCVANTVRDLLTCIPAENLVILTDVSSNVPGFEELGEKFLSEIEQAGVRLMTCDEFSSQF